MICVYSPIEYFKIRCGCRINIAHFCLTETDGKGRGGFLKIVHLSKNYKKMRIIFPAFRKSQHDSDEDAFFFTLFSTVKKKQACPVNMFGFLITLFC